jgi:hypothetical protein
VLFAEHGVSVHCECEADAYTPALQAALQHGKTSVVDVLLDEAQGRWSPGQFVKLLKLALCYSSLGMFQRLWQLPATALLHGEELGQLMHMAATSDRREMFETRLTRQADIISAHPVWSSSSAEEKLTWLDAAAQQPKP